MIDEFAEHEEQHDEIVEQQEKLGDNTKQMEYSEEEQSQPLRRSEGQRVESTKYPSSEYVLINDEGETESLKEVLSHTEKSQWMKVMHEEMGSLKKMAHTSQLNFQKEKDHLSASGSLNSRKMEMASWSGTKLDWL